MSNKPHILIGVPTRGRMHVLTVAAIMNLKMDKRFIVSTYFQMDGLSVENNRNRIVKYFLNGSFDTLVLLDDDVVPPNNFLDLALAGKDIVSGVYRICRRSTAQIENGVFKQIEGKYKEFIGEGQVEVDAVCGGALVVSRAALTLIHEPFTAYRGSDGLWTLGEDLSFCEKAKAVGLRIYADFNYKCGHMTEIYL